MRYHRLTVLVLALALGACTSAGPDPAAPGRTTSSTATADPSSSMSQIARIEVGSAPCAMTSAAGRIWVTLLTAREVVAIDPATNAVVARFGLPFKPCGIATTGSSLWVGGDGATVVELDPASGAIRRSVPVPAPVWDLQPGAGGLWVSLGEKGTVVRIDPAGGTVGAPVSVGSTIGGIAASTDAVYVADTGGHDIAVLDPRTGAVATRWTVPGDPTWLALDGKTLWASLTAQHLLVALDTVTGVVTVTTAAGAEPLDPGASQGRVYVPDHSAETLTWADTSGNHGTIPLPRKGFWVAEVAEGDVWVLDFGGSDVLRMTPARGAGPGADGATTGSAAAADLDELVRRLEAVHPKPFHGIPRQEWLARVAEVKRGLGVRTPQQTLVELMALVAALSRNGRDGHQIVIPLGDERMLPLQVFEFTDGVFVTNSRDPSLTGARLVAVDGRPIADVLAALEPLVPRDSPASVPLFRPFFLLRADVLLGLGIASRTDRIALTLERAGRQDLVPVDTIARSAYEAFAGELGVIRLPTRAGLRFTDHQTLFSVERLRSAAYARLSEVHTVPAEDLARLRALTAEPGVDRVLLDLRQNPGGDNRTYAALLTVLRESRLPVWVLTDRATFSAASNLTTEVVRSMRARVAGEAMGGGLNFWNQQSFLRLEHLPIPVQVGISTEYFERSTPEDPRLTIEPDLPAPYHSADYFAGRDVALDGVLAAPAR